MKRYIYFFSKTFLKRFCQQLTIFLINIQNKNYKGKTSIPHSFLKPWRAFEINQQALAMRADTTNHRSREVPTMTDTTSARTWFCRGADKSTVFQRFLLSWFQGVFSDHGRQEAPRIVHQHWILEHALHTLWLCTTHATNKTSWAFSNHCQHLRPGIYAFMSDMS